MRITPSPRILKMLGQIEFQEWQCLAELVDNSIDALLLKDVSSGSIRSASTDASSSCIEVLIPDQNDSMGDSVVEIRDHAEGMTSEQLQQAVRAGWSGNDLFDRLGLFGMGFNVATARLGHVTRVLTTREGEPNWIGVEIDLDRINQDFEAKDLIEQKEDISEHGTRVIISSLDPRRVDFLSRRKQAIISKLGHIYSWILENSPISIRVNGRLVKPKKHCVWDSCRYVTYGTGRNREEIHAVIQIDERLPDADACLECGNWQNHGKDICDVCGSSNIKFRERKIHGWVGIQRYLDQQNFGVDFIRNGRKILTYDKQVFDWRDPNNPSSIPVAEYPVEIPPRGRIVGEIHLDHVPVHYMKDRFDSVDRNWISAVEYLRGSGPLKPQEAKRLGYPENNSPIGRLFRGYRRNDPGKRCLIPGDGNTAVHQQAAEWAKKFDRGDAEYQSDSKWWDAVVFHEAEVEARNTPPEDTGGTADIDAVVRALQGAAPDSTQAGSEPSTSEEAPGEGGDTARPLTVHEKVTRLLEQSSTHPGLTKDLHSRLLNEGLRLEAHELKSSPLLDGNNDCHTPIWLHPTEGGSAKLFIDPNHEAFTVHGIAVIDLALTQVADFLINRSSNRTYSLSQVVTELRNENFQDNRMDFHTQQNSARDLINEIKSLLTSEASEDPKRIWGVLTSDEIATMESSAAISGAENPALDSEDSSFIQYVPSLTLSRIFEAWPEVFMDGRIFNAMFKEIGDQKARSYSKARVGSLLMDVVALASESTSPGSLMQLRRAALSIELLSKEVRS